MCSISAARSGISIGPGGSERGLLLEFSCQKERRTQTDDSKLTLNALEPLAKGVLLVLQARGSEGHYVGSRQLTC